MASLPSIKSSLSAYRVPAFPQGPRALWTRGQALWIVGRLVLLLVIAGLLLLVRQTETSALFTSPLGRKLLLGAGVYALLGSALELVIYLGLNYVLPPEQGARQILRWTLTIVASAVVTIIFFAPGVFTLLVGPASIQIAETMQHTEP
jgi:hypothetical protein